MFLKRLTTAIGAFAVFFLAAQLRAAPILWQTQWSDALFAQASHDHKFVILDLHAVWCHWCHVMDQETYGDSTVQALVEKRYIPVSVDADSDPELTSRYGDWGWPATIVLAADGTEIVKRRGYIPPAQMAALLQAIIDDPSPGPSVQRERPLPSNGSSRLSARERASLTKVYESVYDDAHGGWGDVHKFIDAASLQLTYLKMDAGDRLAVRRARQTLDANLQLLDPVWGGVYQYSDEVTWNSPHYEKLLAFQSDDLALYSEAYARWRDPRYLAAAQSLYVYLTGFLVAPDGGFYASQDADLSPAVTGHDFYAKDYATRRALGMPRIDTHEYSREAGWAIRALAKFYDVAGDERALAIAERGARWALANRSLPDGGFRHDAKDRGGPFLDDALAMSQAFLALYRSTGDREWLTQTATALAFIDNNFRVSTMGYATAQTSSQAQGVFLQALRQPGQNADLVRVASLMQHYTGEARYEGMAVHGMKYLAAYAKNASSQLHAEILLADHDLANAPIHITVVGSKKDPTARSLHAAALRYPSDYLQIDWWDRDEGPLQNQEIQYPPLEQAAAFVCSASACSLPVFSSTGVAAAVRSALAH